MKRRTKPARRIWAVWYESVIDHGAGMIREVRLSLETFDTKAEAARYATSIKAIGVARAIIEIVCYERRGK